ncbi:MULTISPECIES: hypothetical protein [Brucella/Ochrobactrum group]|uniref:hypothetical protein n=1 Tax=Brucella/Ochrobactrum group TaxID=2826938 RepID=UPI00124E46F6|nr:MULTISPECIES: hypothetical protein [Brucella/Ochrobactrum group]KAB2693195.1 hypothetical protein F9K72_17120 [Brucella intermedia]NKE75532.1 hypothetical protein [Ochrobactrum sp. MC-1LL]
MNADKSWCLSRTVWAGLVTLILSLAGVFGVAADLIDQGALTDVLLQLATAIAGIVTIIGRIGATSRIS